MKKIFNLFLTFIILMVSFIPFVPIYANDCLYEVAVAYAVSDERLSCHNDYNAAYTAMNNYNSTKTAVAVIKQGTKVINARYAIARMNTKSGDTTTNLYDTPSQSLESTYVAGNWGVDAAFIDYHNSYKRAKIMISGYTGYVNINDIEVVPLSRKVNDTLYITAIEPIRVRKEPNTTSDIIAHVTQGSSHAFDPSATIRKGYGGFDWYKIKYGSGYGYVASLGPTWTKEIKGDLNTYYTISNNLITHHIHVTNKWGDSHLDLGTAPFKYDSPGVKTYYLKSGIRYYSFDGNYFYTDIMTMLDDYRNGNYNNSLNKDSPYFNYFMYLSSRSLTGYGEDFFNSIIRGKGYTAKPVNGKDYVNSDGSWVAGKNRSGLSQMYGMGYAFVNSQNTYGVNALQTFSHALTESGSGTSEIAFYKNNIFGMGAFDGVAFNAAVEYSSVEESIMDYAYRLSYVSSDKASNSYSNPKAWVYAGSHQGNKGSGVNVRYASNPYAGEQHASLSFGYDSGNGGLDNYANTLGIKIGYENVPIYKRPSTSSAVIYKAMNMNSTYGRSIANVAFIVIDKVYDQNGKAFYKVFTDPALNSNQDIATDIYYTFENSYGYIEASKLYVQNNQPEIIASNIQIKLDDTLTEIDNTIKNNATASDYEDGNLTSEIVYDDSQVDYTKKGIYPLTYSVKDKSNFNVTKEVTLEILDPEAPIIKFTEVSIPQYTIFDPNNGVEVIDANPNELSEVTYTGEVDTTKVGDYILTYSVTNKFGLTTTAKRIIKVVINESPLINVTNKKVTQFDSINLLSGVTATDKEDGNLTSSITYEGTVNTNIVGDYLVTYKVKDSVGQETVKSITVTVEEKAYLNRDGQLHLESLVFNEQSKLLKFSGFLKINGIDITASTNIRYDLVLENQYDNSIQVIGLNRWLDKVPFTTNKTGYAWFTSDINLDNISAGDYTVYVRARTGNYETKQLLKNVYFKDNISNKITLNGRGYHFRSNYMNRHMPLELFVRDNGLISSKKQSILYNMYNQFVKMNFNNTILNLRGVSHTIGGNYGLDQIVTRELIIENVETLERVKRVNIGSITNGDYKVVLNSPDGYSKTRAWYDTNIDIKDLDKGRYAIYIRTITGNIDDYGEVYDILFKDLNATANYQKDGINYRAKIERNNDKRFRLELVIE
ncbi:MAG: DUF5011 domain-containing protein [Bacilli bacterium]|nr:DUF5011 domain-containing protein [Bacilli bacterium]